MDGLRAIAVIAVMFYHELVAQIFFGPAWNFSGGQYGVDIFFAISGFLITTLLLLEHQRTNRISFTGFYKRRARRILPALWTLLAIVAVVGLFGSETRDTLARVGIATGFASNWVMAATHFGMAEIGQTWSLSVEEQFYFVWPLLLTGLLVLTRKRPQWLPVWVAGLTLLLLLEVVRAVHDGWGGQRIYYGADTRAAALGLGACLGTLYSTGRLPAGRRTRMVLAPVALLAVVAVAPAFHNWTWAATVVGHLGFSHGQPYAVFLTYACVALATTLVIWYLLITPTAIVGKVLAWEPIRWVGRISYGLYLWDGTLTAWTHPSVIGITGWWLMPVHFAMVFAAATASYYLLERRFLTRRQRAETEMPAPLGRQSAAAAPDAVDVDVTVGDVVSG